MKPWQWFSWEGGQTFWPHASGGGRLSSEASPVCRQRCTDWKIKTTVALFFSSQIFYSSHSPKIVMQKHPMGHLAEQTLQRLGQNAYTTNSLSSFAVSVQRKEKKKMKHCWCMRWRWWWWRDRGGGRAVVVVLVRWGGGRGDTDVVPHLQCSAGLHHPIISQLSVKGAGPEADDSQGEFSVRQSERACVW